MATPGDLQDAVGQYAAGIHSPVQLFLDTPPPQRDASRIPTILHSLDGFVLFLQQQVQGKIPLQPYRTLMQQTISLRDQAVACQKALLKEAPRQLTTPSVVLPGGGLKLAIDLQLLEELTNLDYTDTEIAEHFGCHRDTIRRRRKEHGLLLRRERKHQVSEDTLVTVS